MSRRIVQILEDARIAPAGVRFRWRWNDDLIPQLNSIWDATSRPENGLWVRNGSPSTKPTQLRFLHAGGNQVALWSGLGNRFIFYQGDVVAEHDSFGRPRRSLGIASSRIGRNLAGKSGWFRSLRAACAQALERQEIVLTSQGTSTARFVQRCAALFGVTVGVIRVSNAKSVGVWYRDEVLKANRIGSEAILISPPIESCEEEPARSFVEAPDADCALAAMSDRLIILSARRNGNWDRLVRWRLKSKEFGIGTTLLALGARLTTNHVRDELLAAGTVGWTLRDSTVQRSCDSTAKLSSAPSQTIFSSRIEFDGYLAHCTRRRDGPWPNQSEQAYLDDLILEKDDADHTPLATLTRIMSMKCLLGSSDSIGGDTPVVSLTAVPLDELHQLRVFRPHRGRWDFEPYGVCIRRSWIEKQNGKPVRYASREEWDRLSRTERLFWHLDLTKTSSGSEIDWEVEQEWRVVGDIDLGGLSADDAFVFVPTLEESHAIGETCPWPIVVLSELGEAN